MSVRSYSPAKFRGGFSNSLFSSPNLVSILSSKFNPNPSSFKFCCSHKQDAPSVFQGFSVLSSDIPWDIGSTWSTMAVHLFSLHIPLSFGGLSIVAQILHQPVLDLQTEALSLIILQSTELVGTLALLLHTAKHQHKLANFFQGNKFSEGRNWIQGAAIGFGFLMLLVLLTSLIADKIIGPKAVNNSMLKEILSSGPVAKAACFFVYCFITPLWEEIIYRGFLLTSLASTMEWWRAVILSACVFSVVHFSAENSLQLVIIGCVLGCTYCWTGKLESSFAIHSVYNAVILLATMLA
ncbi:uncharacterized protein LOC143857269 [Tasmannia lanceolata]|uniref:uncharacterized protein LOC143857269 n=1 Tax=Tasmannia lanceolata TaxID=3420 RepID=UPI004063E881